MKKAIFALCLTAIISTANAVNFVLTGYDPAFYPYSERPELFGESGGIAPFGSSDIYYILGI